MAAVTAKQGYLPVAVALLAESPETLDGFLRLSAVFEGCTLDPLAREVVIMTVATRNGCGSGRSRCIRCLSMPERIPLI